MAACYARHRRGYPAEVIDVLADQLRCRGDRMPPAASRAEFADRVRVALAPHVPLTERVTVWIQTGR